MLLTITNLTGSNVSIESLRLTLTPYTTRSVSVPDSEDQQFSKNLSDDLTALKNNNRISYTSSEDPEIDDAIEASVINTFEGVYRIRMDNAPDVSGGGNSVPVGFQLVSVANTIIKKQELVELAVFTTPDLVAFSANAILNSAIEGTILDGENSSAIKVRTDANGRFSCQLVDNIDETVYLSTINTPGGPALVNQEIDSVAFSA